MSLFNFFKRQPEPTTRPIRNLRARLYDGTHILSPDLTVRSSIRDVVLSFKLERALVVVSLKNWLAYKHDIGGGPDVLRVNVLPASDVSDDEMHVFGIRLTSHADVIEQHTPYLLGEKVVTP